MQPSITQIESARIETAVAPFLKWAGGKRWLVEQRPELFDQPYDRYIEPFLGSGAVYFFLRPSKAILADTNERLIEVYCQIKHNYKKVEASLAEHHRRHSKDYYYAQRQSRKRSPAGRAAQFLYLNRTCWNGLYRVNLRGEFNVPIGTKTNVLLDSDNFARTSQLLQRSEIVKQDFSVTLNEAAEGDLVFVDPPYTVKHNNNGFVKYNEQIFSWKDQLRLRDSIADAIHRGAKVIMSNADHESVRDLYYSLGSVSSLNRTSVIAAKSKWRGQYSELIFTSR